MTVILKVFVGLNPDLDVSDLNLEDLTGKLRGQSIDAIRAKMVSILKDVFSAVQRYSEVLKKLFYVCSLALLIADAVGYLRAYYSDGSYDNMYVDDNLRRVWRDGQDEKLTPLRNWELNEKYQVSVDLKLTKREVKR